MLGYIIELMLKYDYILTMNFYVYEVGSFRSWAEVQFSS